jgi:PAS domain S-box-containing protein
MHPHSLINNILLLASLITALTVIGGALWRWVWRPVWRAVRELKAILAFIEAELRPNGGSSIRDAVNRMEMGIEAANKKIDLVAQRQLQRTNLDATGLWETDRAGRFTFVNPAMARLAGAAPEDFLGLGWKTHVHPRDRAEVSASWQSAVQDERDFTFVFAFGNEVKVRVTGRRMRGANGDVTGWIGDCRAA